MNCTIFNFITTGKSIYNDRIIRIDAIRVKDNKFISKYCELVKTYLTVPKEVEENEHINNDLLLRKGGHAKNTHESFLDYIEDDILIGYNTYQQHIPMLNDTYWRMKIKCKTNRVVDILHIMRRHKICFKKGKSIIDRIHNTIRDENFNVDLNEEAAIRMNDFNEEVGKLSEYMLSGEKVRIISKKGKIHTVVPINYLQKKNKTCVKLYLLKTKESKVIRLDKFDKICERR